MQKEILKKILIIFLILFIFIGASNVKSMAQIKIDDTGELIISGLEAGLTVTVYKLATVNYDYDVSQEPLEPPYEWVESIKDYLASNDEYNTYVDTEVYQNATKDDTNAVAKFYDTLAAAIRSEELELDATKTETVPGSATASPGEADQSLTIDGLTMGTYLILIENGYKVYKPSVVNLVPVFDNENSEWKMSTPAEVIVKSSEPTITKEVEDNSVNIGDRIKYTIKADVPQYPDKATAKGYYISDILSNGLSYIDSSLQVFGLNGTKETLINDSDYVVSNQRPNSIEPNKTSFTLCFKYDNIKEYEKIKVMYEAELNSDPSTIVASDGNKNEAYLDYNNNPYSDESWKTKETSINVFTYGMIVNKKDKLNDQMLTGAEFILSTDEEGSNKIAFKKNSDGVYYRTSDLATDENVKLKVGSESELLGKLDLRGLDEGTYYLTETIAPNGYNKLKNSIKVEVKNTILTVDVHNTKGFVLPITGGSGTVIFTVVGSIFFGIGLLLVAIIIYRKVNNKK